MAGVITFKPVIYSQYRRTDGSYFVRIRVTANRKSKYIVTNIAVTDKQITRSFKIKDVAVIDAVNDLLSRLRKAASTLDTFIIPQMSIDSIVQYVSLRQEGSFRLDFFKFAESVIQRKSNAGTRYVYNVALNSFRKFWGKPEMDISELKSTTLRRYESWLSERLGQGATSVKIYISTLRHIHRIARETYNSEESGDILIRDPFAYYHLAKARSPQHRNVSAEIIQRVIDERARLKNKPEKFAADLFVLSFAMMGLNLADMFDAPAPDGDILIYNRRKTRTRRDDRAEMRVKIDPRIRPLYDKYQDPSGKYAFARKYPEMKELQFAVAYGMKKLVKALGIEERITFYSARHTWATLAYSIGIDKSVINDCLCHTDSAMKVTDVYIAKDWRVLWEANKKVLDLFDWSNI